MFHEPNQVAAAKSALAPLTDPKTLQPAGVRPSAERCLADVEESGSFGDIEEIVWFSHAENLRGFTG